MQLWGKIKFNQARFHWAVTGKWQGRRYYFSQIPTAGGGFLTCRTHEHAAFLQQQISIEMERNFNPARYQQCRPLHFEKYTLKWLEDKKPSISYVTWKGYRSYLHRHIIPHFAGEYLPDLNYQKLIEFFNSLSKTLSIKTIKNVFGCLHHLMEDARRSGYINQLPEWVQFSAGRSVPQRKINWLDADTQAKILAEIPPQDRHIFQFIFATGVRPSEARALRKKDVKADHIVIAVTFAPAPGGEALKVVKNRREEAIPLYDSVREILAATPGNLTEFVFINPATGKPYTKNINRDIWNPASCRTMGYVFPLNNAGRHSFANQLLAAGADFAVVSKALRHSSLAITKTNYGEPHLQVMKSVVDNIQKLQR